MTATGFPSGTPSGPTLESLPSPDSQTPPGRDSSQLFWRLLLTASAIAATVSLLTTGLGLDRYVSRPLAWSLAIAVQLGLFGLAWLIGVGRERRPAWIVALYAVTMLFSVTFSYVTLQSELTSEIRPAEARRELFDETRSQLAETRRLVTEGRQQSESLELRLASWMSMERRDGWATRTCEVEDHCYLEATCDRIRRRIEQWERETGQTYREGPGEKLIFGTLTTEHDTLVQLGRRLEASERTLIAGGGVLDDGLDNRERLRRLDTLLATVPVDDLEAVTCQAITPPQAPAYGDHARDDASGEERPVYAFEDLAVLFEADHVWTREDYPTVFALALALFIDVFVLVVALGAATVAQQSGVAWAEGAPPVFEQALQNDIDGWLGVALADLGDDPGRRKSFLGELLTSLDFGRAGEARLVPGNAEQQRFGHLLVQARAARVEPFLAFNRIGRRFLFEPWVVPALTRHLAAGS